MSFKEYFDLHINEEDLWRYICIISICICIDNKGAENHKKAEQNKFSSSGAAEGIPACESHAHVGQRLLICHNNTT